MSNQDYYQLTPELVFQAIESCGYKLDGTLLALNSYENRVYRLADIKGTRYVAKFYRPGRWSNEQILEEHEFAFQMAEREIPVVAPLELKGQSTNVQSTLGHWQDFRFALFPCVGGREPELENLDNLEQLGRYLGRMHALGAVEDFKYRPTLDVASYGTSSIETILAADFIPLELRNAYQAIATQVLELIKVQFDQPGEIAQIRIHADFHPGNILWHMDGPNIVDLDDARMGPAIQDLWMLIGVDPETQLLHFDCLMDGYSDFFDLPLTQLRLIEPLRSLRMLHYSAWLARRWDDPSFKHHFPWFAESRYWEQQILQLKEQLAMLQDDQTLSRLTPLQH